MDGELYGALLYLALFGSVIAFGAYFTLVGRIGPGKAAYSTLLFPLVALSISTVYEGYVWHLNGIVGLLLILGNMVMFTKPETGSAACGRHKKRPAKMQAFLLICCLMNIKHSGIRCHVIHNLLQGAEAHWRILVRQLFPFPLRTTLITGLFVAASISSPSKNRCVSMVRWPVAICVPATSSATGTTS